MEWFTIVLEFLESLDCWKNLSPEQRLARAKRKRIRHVMEWRALKDHGLRGSELRGGIGDCEALYEQMTEDEVLVGVCGGNS